MFRWARRVWLLQRDKPEIKKMGLKFNLNSRVNGIIIIIMAISTIDWVSLIIKLLNFQLVGCVGILEKDPVIYLIISATKRLCKYARISTNRKMVCSIFDILC